MKLYPCCKFDPNSGGNTKVVLDAVRKLLKYDNSQQCLANVKWFVEIMETVSQESSLIKFLGKEEIQCTSLYE
jgi:hypothetical protein